MPLPQVVIDETELTRAEAERARRRAQRKMDVVAQVNEPQFPQIEDGPEGFWERAGSFFKNTAKLFEFLGNPVINPKDRKDTQNLKDVLGRDPSFKEKLLSSNKTQLDHLAKAAQAAEPALQKVALLFDPIAESIASSSQIGLEKASFGTYQAPRAAHETLEALKDMFMGDVSPAQAAGLLREQFQNRSGLEQVVLGLVADPLNLLLTLGSGGTFGAAKAALAAGRTAKVVKTGAEAVKLAEQTPAFRRLTPESQKVIRNLVGGGSGTESEITKLVDELVGGAADEALQGFAKETRAIEGRVVSLARVQTADAAKEQVLLEMLRGTGSRPGPVLKMTRGELDDLANQIKSGAGRVMAIQRTEADQTRAIPLLAESRERLLLAIERYRGMVGDKWKADDLAFPSPKGGPWNYTNFLKKTKGDLPKQASKFRKLVAQQLWLQGADMEAVAAQLGHASADVTRNFYVRELGLSGATKEAELLSGLAQTSPEGFASVQQALAGVRGKRAKGAKVGLGELQKELGGFGQELIDKLPLSATHTTVLEHLVGGDEAELFRQGAKLFSLRKAMFEVGRAVDSLKAHSVQVKKFLAEARAAKDSDRVKSLQLAARDSDSRLRAAKAMVKAISGYLREETRLWSNDVRAAFEGGVPDYFDDLVKTLRGADPSELEEAKRAGFAIRGAGIVRQKRQALAAEEVGVHLRKMPLDYKELEKRTKALFTGPVVSFLNDQGLRHGQPVTRIEKVLAKAARSVPEIMGQDFVVLSPEKQAERIADYAAFLSIKQDKVLTKFRAAPPRVKRPKPVVKVEYDGVDRGAALAMDEPPEVSVGLVTGMDTYVDLENIAVGVETNPKLKALIDKIPRYPFTSGMGSLHDIAENTVTAILGGTSWLQDEFGRAVLALRQANDRAQTIRDTVIQAAKHRLLDRAGVRLEPVFKPAVDGLETGKAGGGRWRMPAKDVSLVEDFSLNRLATQVKHEETLEEIGQLYKGLAGAPGGFDTPANYMRDLQMILRIHPEDWDVVYKFRSRQVRDGLLHLHHIVEQSEQYMKTANEVHGYVPKFRGDRIKGAYFPTIAVKSDRGIRDVQRSHLTQSQPWFFQERQHEHYVGAILDGTDYADEFESLGLYIQNVHMNVNEHQMVQLIKENSDWAVPTRELGNHEKASRALTRILASLREGTPVGLKDIEVAEKHNPALYRVVRNHFDNERSANVVKKIAARYGQAYREAREFRDSHFDVDLFNQFTWDDARAKRIRQLTQEGQNVLLDIARTTRPISQTLRFFRTGIDMGIGMIHLFPGLFGWSTVKPFGKGPIPLPVSQQWLKATKAMWGTFFDERYVRQYYSKAENAGAKALARDKGFVVYGQAEPVEIFRDEGRFFAAVERGSAAVDEKILQGVKKLGKDIGEEPRGLRRFQDAFNTGLDVMRTELWKALSRADMSDEELRHLGATINKMTGGFNMAMHGTTPTQRLVEAGMLFFAPIYRRASYGLIMDAFRADKFAYASYKRIKGGAGAGRAAVPELQKSTEALKRIMGMVSVGAIAGMLGYFMAGGDDDRINPKSPKFMTIPVGNFNLGIGTAFYSMARLGSGLYGAATTENGRADWNSLPDNQMFRWLRGQAAPLTAAATDFYFGRTFLGDPLREPDSLQPNYRGLFEYSVEHSIPFWLDTENTGAFTHGGGWAMAAEFMGFRTFPLSVFDKVRAARDAAVLHTDDEEIAAWRQTTDNPTWRNLPVLFKRRLETNNKDLQDLAARVKELDLERGDEFDRDFQQFTELIDANRASYNQRLTLLQQEWNTTPMSGQQFRDKLGDINEQYRFAAQQIAERHQNVIVELDDSRRSRLESNTGYIGDLAYDLYLSNVIGNRDLYDEFGNLIPEEFDRAQREWWGAFDFDPAVLDYVEERRKTGRLLPPVVQEFQLDRDKMDGYWRLHEELFGEGTRGWQVIEDYLALKSSRMKSNYLDASPGARGIVRRWENARKLYRRRNPEIDAILVKWFDNSPVTQLGRQALQELDTRL